MGESATENVTALKMTQTVKADPAKLKIGELLVREGLVKQADVAKAMGIQRQEAAQAQLPLGILLVKKGYLTQEDLQKLLEHPELRTSIEAMALDGGLVDADQMALCKRSRGPGEEIGDALVRKGCITGQDLKTLKQKQLGALKLGELALHQGMIDRGQLEEVLAFKQASRTLGEILCFLNLISPADLNYVLQKYNKQLKLGEILLKQGIISEDQLKLSLKEQRHRAEPLGTIMLQNKFISVGQLYRALSKQYNLPFQALEGFAFEPGQKNSLASIVGSKYAEKNHLIPLTLEGSLLTVAVSNPESLRIIQELRSVYTHLRMNCVLVTEEKLAELFGTLYGKPLESLKLDPEKKGAAERVDLLEIEIDERDGRIEKEAPYGISDMEAEEIVNFIIKYGILNGASDIHIEQDRKGAKLRYRLDGMLQTLKLKWLDEKIQEMVGAIISRIKVMSNLDIAERRMPQDGVFRVNYFDKDAKKNFDLDFRVATCPAIVGENITIRILDSRKANVGLNSLGHSPHVLDPLKRLLKSSAGMVLVSGPTGSGKSSTLYSALQYIYNPGVKIITAEDPIEYSFPGIMQTQVNPKIQLTFSRLLRSFLRLDPDVILVGEMRDAETARIGFDAAQTGHLLLSTIHTNDSFGAITRLLDLNVEYNQMASSLMGVLAQRLVRKICPICRERCVPVEEEWSLLFRDYPDNLTFYRGTGCSACDFTGYNGRSLISELLVIDRDISHSLNRGAGENEIKRVALGGGMKTMVDDGLMKLEMLTLSEIIRVVPHEMVKEFKSRPGPAAVSSPDALAPDEGSGAPPDVNGKLVISDPAAEVALLERLCEKYEEMKTSQGQPCETTQADIFKRFITERHHSICSAHGCPRVAFELESRAGRVEIYAQPQW